MEKNDLLVKKANKLFQEKRFEEAYHIYQQAAEIYGGDFVSLNIQLCKENLEKPKPKLKPNINKVFYNSNMPTSEEDYIAILECQLIQTQNLAEKYFKEYQLQKQKSKGL